MKTVITLLLCVFVIPGLFSQTIDPRFTLPCLKKVEEKSEIADFYSNHFSEEMVMLRSGPEDERLDSLNEWKWDASPGAWKLNLATHYTSNADGLLENEVLLGWSQSPRKILKKHTYAYDENNRRTETLYQVWNETEWNNYSLITITYDPAYEHSEQLYQIWDGVEWVNSNLTLFTYDSNHNLISAVSKKWESDEWINESQSVYTYNANNFEVLYLKQVWSDDWQNDIQNISVYDIENNLTEKIYKKWFHDDWTRNYRDLNVYDAENNLVHSLRQKPAGELDWINRSQNFYAFDSYHHVTGVLAQRFENDVWTDVVQGSLTYTENQNQLSLVFKIWQGEWINVDSMHYYYTTISANKDLTDDDPEVYIFPNPAINTLNLNLNGKFTGEVTLEIYNSTGTQVIASKINSLQIKPLDISNLIPGLYHFIIGSYDKKSSGTFVKL